MSISCDHGNLNTYAASPNGHTTPEGQNKCNFNYLKHSPSFQSPNGHTTLAGLKNCQGDKCPHSKVETNFTQTMRTSSNHNVSKSICSYEINFKEVLKKKISCIKDTIKVLETELENNKNDFEIKQKLNNLQLSLQSNLSQLKLLL